MPDVTPIVLQQIDLDIVPGKIPPIVHVSEYDTGRQILVNLFRDGYPFGTNSIESYTVKVEGTIGKYGFSEDASWASDAEGVVAISLTEAMTAIHGRVWTKIKLIKSESMQISTCGFWLDCDRAGVNAQDVIEAKGFEAQIQQAVENYLDAEGVVSPTITISDIQGGHRLTIKDVNHPSGQTVDVMDGEDGFSLPSGGQSGDALLSNGRGGAYWGQAQGGGTGLSDDVKQALLDCFANVAWKITGGQTLYDALEDALYPPADLESISAIFSQGSHIIYNTDSLNTLKQYLTVVAQYSDSSTAAVTSYTLSGTLSVGTSTITVTYTEDGITKTATFTVNVTADARKSDMNGWYAEIPYTDLEIVENSYVATQNGVINSYSGWNRTGYIPCHGVMVLNIPPLPEMSANARSNWFYDENKNPLSNVSQIGSANSGLSKTEFTYVVVPENAHYFILSSEAEALASCVNAGIVPSMEPLNWSDGVPYSDIDVVSNSYYDVEQSGAIRAYSGWDRTVLVPCYHASRIKFPAHPQVTSAKWNAFFNLRRGYISNFTLNIGQETVVDVPSNAAWFAVSTESAALATLLSGDIIPYSTPE